MRVVAEQPIGGGQKTQGSSRSSGRAKMTAARDDISLGRMAMTRRTSLQLPDRLGLEGWSRVGRNIALMRDASSWWLGDWIIYGQDKFPNHYKRVMAETSLDYQTLRNYAWVVRRYAVSRRRDNLSFQHHAEVASLEEPDQDLWLDRAAHSRWSLRELRKQLAKARAGNRVADDSVEVIVRLSVSAEKKHRWQCAAEVEHKELSDWIALLMDMAADRALGA
jgi:hypothetical protein